MIGWPATSNEHGQEGCAGHYNAENISSVHSMEAAAMNAWCHY